MDGFISFYLGYLTFYNNVHCISKNVWHFPTAGCYRHQTKKCSTSLPCAKAPYIVRKSIPDTTNNNNVIKHLFGKVVQSLSLSPLSLLSDMKDTWQSKHFWNTEPIFNSGYHLLHITFIDRRPIILGVAAVHTVPCTVGWPADGASLC